MVMGRQLTKKIGYISSSVFFEIGNIVNLAKFFKPNVKICYPKDEREALKKDWDAVGKGVQKSFDKFERIYGFK